MKLRQYRIILEPQDGHSTRIDIITSEEDAWLVDEFVKMWDSDQETMAFNPPGWELTHIVGFASDAVGYIFEQEKKND